MNEALGVFLPWPLFLLGKILQHPELGAGAATLVMILWMLFQRQVPKLPDFTLLLYFLFLSHLVIPERVVAPVEPILAPLLLLLMALGSLLFGKPFTEQYAREQVDTTLWNDPAFPVHFRRVNRFLTLAWALAFLLSLQIALFSHGWFFQIENAAIFLAAVALTWFYPRWYHRAIYQPGKDPRP